MVDIEFIALLGGGVWFLCGVYLGYKSPQRIPREFGVLFMMLSVMGAAIGVSIFFPAGRTDDIARIAVWLYSVTPFVFVAYLMWVYPKQKPPGKPRGLGKRYE